MPKTIAEVDIIIIIIIITIMFWPLATMQYRIIAQYVNICRKIELMTHMTRTISI